MDYNNNYVTPDEYKSAYGEDLDLVAPKLDDPTNAAKRVIGLVQENLIAYLDANYQHQDITQANLVKFKRALLRCIYVCLNKCGLNEIQLDETAYHLLRMGGFCNAKRYSGN